MCKNFNFDQNFPIVYHVCLEHNNHNRWVTTDITKSDKNGRVLDATAMLDFKATTLRTYYFN